MATSPCSRHGQAPLGRQGSALARGLKHYRYLLGNNSTDSLRDDFLDGYLGQMTDGDKCLLSHKFQLVGGVAGGAQVFGVSEKWVQILTLSLNLLLQQVT